MTDISQIGVIEDLKTNEEITDASVPDPDNLPEIGGDYLLIRPVQTKAEKIGSILLPEDFQEDVKYLHNVGRILAIGPRCYKKSDDSVVKWFEGGLKVGDVVQWERFVGKRLRYKGVNLVLVKDTALQMKVADPEDLDPMTSVEA